MQAVGQVLRAGGGVRGWLTAVVAAVGLWAALALTPTTAAVTPVVGFAQAAATDSAPAAKAAGARSRIIAQRRLGRRGGRISAEGITLIVPSGVMSRTGKVRIRKTSRGVDFHIFAPWRGYVHIVVPGVSAVPFLAHRVMGEWVVEDGVPYGRRTVFTVRRLSIFDPIKRCLGQGRRAALACLAKMGVRSVTSNLLGTLLGSMMDKCKGSFSIADLLLDPCTLDPGTVPPGPPEIKVEDNNGGDQQQNHNPQQPVNPPAPPPPPPAEPRPTAGNLRVVVHGGGHVGVAFDVGWQAGRDPVFCHHFIDGVEVFTIQCGTQSSKQFYGITPGTHSFYATVSDRFGVYSAPTNTVVSHVT